MNILSSSGERRLRDIKRRLVLAHYLGEGSFGIDYLWDGTFWVEIKDTRGRWGIKPEVRLPPAYLPLPYSEDDSEEAQEWAAEMDSFRLAFVKDGWRYQRATDWDAFFGACVLYEPPELKLDRFADLRHVSRPLGSRYRIRGVTVSVILLRSTNHRAEEVERSVSEFVSRLMRDPQQLREDLERMMELERRGAHGNPKREMKSWLDKLAEVDSERRSYIKLAARGTITDLELDEALGDLEETRATAERELAALRNQQEALKALELDRDVLLERYAAIAPEALDSLIPEERHRLYKLLRITVIVQPDTTLEVSGIFGEGLSVSSQGLVS